MPPKPKYRLQVLLVIKERAKREREIALAKAIQKLAEEERKLKELEEEKKKIEDRIEKERRELHDKIAAGGALIKDPQVRENFLRKLKEDLEEMERRIEEQKEEIRQAKLRVQRARQDYVLAAQELNVMEKHKDLWRKKLVKELNEKEDKLMGELGQVVYELNKRR